MKKIVELKKVWVEPDWEEDIAKTAKKIQKEIRNQDHEWGFVDNEIRKLVNKLTEHWY